MKLFILIFLFFGGVFAKYPTTINFNGKTWTLNKIRNGNYSSVNIDTDGNLFFVEGRIPYVIENNGLNKTSRFPLSHQIADMVIDSNGTMYFGGNYKIYKSLYKWYVVEKIAWNIPKLVKCMTIDATDNIYFIMEDTIGISLATEFGETFPLSDLGSAKDAFAVDSKRHFYYKNATGNAVKDTGMQIDKIENMDDANVKSVLVDRKDNVYFGTEKGIYYMEKGTLTATKIDVLDLPIISKFALDKNENIYMASEDIDGGIFSLIRND